MPTSLVFNPVKEKDYKIKLSICNYITCNIELKLKDGDGKTTKWQKNTHSHKVVIRVNLSEKEIFKLIPNG